jgi:hypothetical protein
MCNKYAMHTQKYKLLSLMINKMHKEHMHQRLQTRQHSHIVDHHEPSPSSAIHTASDYIGKEWFRLSIRKCESQ